MTKLKESTKREKKIRASQNKAKNLLLKNTTKVVKDFETKSKRKDLAAQLGEAVIRREKLAQRLNRESELCNRLATEMEKLGE